MMLRRHSLVVLLLLLLLLVLPSHLADCSLLEKSSFDVDAWQVGKGRRHDVKGSWLKDSCFEAYWNDLPSPVVHENKGNNVIRIRVNGQSFRGRMSALKYLMYAVDPPKLWGPSNNNHDREWHWLWGYACQLDWEHRSGRFNNPLLDEQQQYEHSNTSVDDDTISPESWWGYMNFCFSVAILLGFEKSGWLQEAYGGGNDRKVLIELDDASQAMLERSPGIQESVVAWETLFRNGYTDFRKKILDDDDATTTLSSNNEKDSRTLRFHLQQEVWKAHTSVIAACRDKDPGYFQELSNLLPPAEQKFGQGWALMVEILAAATFPTDLRTLQEDGAGFLPLQVVTESKWRDWQEAKKNDHKLERRRFKAVAVTHDLMATPASTLHTMASFWKRVVRNNERISRSMPNTVNELVHGKIHVKLKQLVRVLYLFIKP